MMRISLALLLLVRSSVLVKAMDVGPWVKDHLGVSSIHPNIPFVSDLEKVNNLHIPLSNKINEAMQKLDNPDSNIKADKLVDNLRKLLYIVPEQVHTETTRNAVHNLIKPICEEDQLVNSKNSGSMHLVNPKLMGFIPFMFHFLLQIIANTNY